MLLALCHDFNALFQRLQYSGLSILDHRHKIPSTIDQLEVKILDCLPYPVHLVRRQPNKIGVREHYADSSAGDRHDGVGC